MVVDLGDHLFPILLTEIPVDGGQLQFRVPLRLEPEWEENLRYVSASAPDLGLDAVSASRADLLRELDANVRFLWRTYAMAPDETLSPGALTWKRNLLSRIEFVAEGPS